MAYTPFHDNWTEFPDTTTPLTAEAVEYIEAGIVAASEAVEAVTGGIASHLADTSDAHDASSISFVPDGTIEATDVQAAIVEVRDEAAAAGAGAPTNANYLVGTTNAGLSDEIVVGTTPGGELGGTWGSPTVDATHSGSSHAAVQAAAEATAQAALDAHTGDTSDAHDASAISIEDAGSDFTATTVEGALDELQADHEVDAAALTTHEADTTSVHGVADTSTLYRAGGTDVALADGGTGSSTAAAALLALGAIPSDGWVNANETWTYASASTFTVPGDQAAKFPTGTKLKFTQTTVKYGVVYTASHAAGTTTVTIVVNTSHVLANAAISDNYYSYADSPQGYPGWFVFTPAWTASGTAPAIVSGTVSGAFFISGRLCVVQLRLLPAADSTLGTGNYFLSIPVACVYPTPFGSADFYDASVGTVYPFFPRYNSTTTLSFLRADVTGTYFGKAAPVDLAASDEMKAMVTYRL